jgi:L-glyceraldehyde 3-phosphate reductase
MTASAVPSRRIGADGPLTGVLALGSWHTYDRMAFGETVDLLRTAVDAGLTLFDVGVYGMPGHPPVFTDVIFSAAVRAAGLAREDYLLSAKLWLEGYPPFSRGYPEYPLRGQLEQAFIRAGVEHADVVILGDLRDQHTDLEQLVLDLAALREAGLIRQWGINNWSATSVQALLDAAAAHGVAGPAMAQLKYSVARRSIADGAPFAKIFAQGVTLEASDVLEGGLLLGKSGRDVGRDPGGVRERITGSAGLLRSLSEQVGATPAQLCVAFTLTHPALTSTLFGATSVAQLKENIGAVDLVARVGADELRALAEPLWADKDAVDPEGP